MLDRVLKERLGLDIRLDLELRLEIELRLELLRLIDDGGLDREIDDRLGAERELLLDELRRISRPSTAETTSRATVRTSASGPALKSRFSLTTHIAYLLSQAALIRRTRTCHDPLPPAFRHASTACHITPAAERLAIINLLAKRA